MKTKQTLIDCLGGNLKTIIKHLDEKEFELIEEIRVRVNLPLIIKYKNKEIYIDKLGNKTGDIKNSYIPTPLDIALSLELISGYSIYAFDEEIRNGYITIDGGHRIGISGKVVSEGGYIKTIRNISGINIRISHQVTGCADKVMGHVTNNNEVLHTLIVSPPGCGKTTLLRDIIRQVSNDKNIGQAVGVVDERSELGGSFMGVAQNDLGARTDILDGCPKALGMLMLLRSMSPGVIAVDEIGRREDVDAINEILNTGVKVICTVHGRDLQDLESKPVLGEIIHRKIFQLYIVLSNEKRVGEIKGIYNKDFEKLACLEVG